MRKVLKSHSECAHFWANKVQSEGRASRVFFEGDKIFSYGYHFCIARHLSSGVVAFTKSKYSVSTAKHVNECHSAARHLKKVYCYAPDASVQSNFNNTEKEIKHLLRESVKPRIRQTTRERLQLEALNEAMQFNDYFNALSENERYNVVPFDTSNFDSLRDKLIESERLKFEAERERKKALEIELAEYLQDWRTDLSMRIRSGFHQLNVALRLNTEKNTIETTRGAEIPVSDALKLWPLILRTMKGEKDFIPGSPVGNYRLTKIRTDGSLVVGCHDIAHSELKAIAAQLGLI